MNRTQTRIANSIRATIRKASLKMQETYTPQGLSADEYGIAWSAQKEAESLARYLLANMAGLDRKAFAVAAGVEGFL
jgi:hypothetical protein